jgi:hypothetical protein
MADLSLTDLAVHALSQWFLAWLFCPEDGGDMFLRNVGLIAHKWLSASTDFLALLMSSVRIVGHADCDNIGLLIVIL